MEFPEIYCQYMYSYPHKTAYRPLFGLNAADYFPTKDTEPFSLYLHLPFCESKCGYCNLFSVTGQNEAFFSDYLDAVERQAMQYLNAIKHTAPAISFDSLTIGGGTPLLLSETQLDRLFSITCHFPFKESVPVIVETSPRQTTEQKLQILKHHHVTRVSIGIQSFHDRELQILNRRHTVHDCKRALSLLASAGFLCRNLDLIYGIPGQTTQSLQYSIDAALSYQPEELFLYPLYIKQGTSLFHKDIKASPYAYELYLFASNYLKEHGYQQVSMRRFTFTPSEPYKDYESYEKSCGFENTLSLGCGARSYLKNLHFCTPYHIRPSFCLKEIRRFLEPQDYLQISFGYLLNTEEMLRRFVIKNLLHTNGIAEKEYFKAKQLCSLPCNTSMFEDFPIMENLLHEHLAIWDGQRIALTEKGLSLSDAIGPLFISNAVKEKMEQWTEESF